MLYIMKNIKRKIGLISKINYYISTNTLVGLYYALIHPFLTYSLMAWSNTLESNIKPLFLLQKRAIRIITFASFMGHSSSIFKSLKFVKFLDLVKIITVVSIYKFHKPLLPTVFPNFFTFVRNIHNTRLASKSSFALPISRTNYGIFSLEIPRT